MNLRKDLDYQSMTPLAVVRVALMGAVVGAMTWLLLLGLERYILKPLFCDVSNSYCTAIPTMALSMALVVGHFIDSIYSFVSELYDHFSSY